MNTFKKSLLLSTALVYFLDYSSISASSIEEDMEVEKSPRSTHSLETLDEMLSIVPSLNSLNGVVLWERKIIIDAISKVLPEDREDVLSKSFPLIRERPGYAASFIRAISEILPEDREDVLEKSSLLIKSVDSPSDKIEIIEYVKFITPQTNREGFVNKALALMNNFLLINKDKVIVGDEIINILDAVSGVPSDDYSSILRKADRYFKDAKDGYDLANTINMISLLPLDQREDQLIEDLINFAKNGDSSSSEDESKQFQKYAIKNALSALEFLPDSLIKEGFYSFNDLKEQDEDDFYVKAESPGSLVNYFISQDSAYKSETFNYWRQTLEEEHNQDKVAPLVDFLIDGENLEGLDLEEDHEIAQLALSVQTLIEDSTDPMNPYHFFKVIKERSAQPVEWSKIEPMQEMWLGYRFHFNPQFLKNELPKYQERLTYGQLPAYSKDILKRLSQELKTRTEEDAICETAIQEMTEASYKVLIDKALGDGFLQRKLDVQGESDQPVPLVATRFISIINYLQSLSSEREEGEIFSPQEESFLKILSSIQGCPHGKEGGIHGAFLHFLPPQFKLKAVTNSIEDEYVIQDLQALSHTLREDIERMFSGQNIFTKSLIGLQPHEKVNEATHQAFYLKNLIGREVGLTQGIKFDRHSSFLYKQLVDQSKDEVMQVFYKHFAPSAYAKKAFEYYQKENIFDEFSDVIEHLENLGIMKITKRPE